jgi:hypothetical protein
MADYITTDELDMFLLGAASADFTKKDFAVTAASRMFDRLADVEDDYFSVAGVSASNKIVQGNGLTILHLPPFVGSLGTVIYEDGTADEVTVDTDLYTLKGTIPNQYLETYQRRYYDAFGYLDWIREWSPDGHWYNRSVWRENRNYTISARWGFTAIPQDVKTSVIQLAISLMSDLDTAKAERLESKTDVKDHVPAMSMAALTANKYRGFAGSLGI